jgi:hypothetical protein
LQVLLCPYGKFTGSSSGSNPLKAAQTKNPRKTFGGWERARRAPTSENRRL